MRTVRTGPVVRGLATAMALFAVHGWWFADSWYLTEFRDWVLWPVGFAEIGTTAWGWLTCADLFPRSVGLLLARSLGTVLGDDWWLANTLLLTLVPIAAFLLHRLVLWLGGSERVAFAAIGLWAVHPATIDCIRWQATVHDRLGLVFVLLTLLAFVGFARRDRLGPAGLLLANVAVTIPLVLAFHSKEATWCVWPALAALTATGVGRGERSWRARAALLVLPLAWSLWYFGTWFLVDAVDAEHVLSGDLGRNLRRHTRLLTSPLRVGWPVVLLVVLGAGGLAARVRDLRPLLGLGVVAFVGGFVLAVPARLASPYYMFLPAVFFDLLACTVVGALVAGRWRWLAVFAWLLVFGTTAVQANERAQQSRGFSQGLRDARSHLAAVLPGERPTALQFVVPEDMIPWVAGNGAGLARHLFGREDWRAFAGVPVEVLFEEPGRPREPGGVWRFAFGGGGRLEGVWIGARRVL